MIPDHLNCGPCDTPGFAWNEPLLAAVVPDAKSGLSVLQLLRLGVGEDDGSNGHYLCSVVLQENGQQPTGNLTSKYFPVSERSR